MPAKNITYDTAVVGAGVAGCMAAIRAGQLRQTVLLIERNYSIGHKILLTSNGRCNLTNTASLEIFLKKFSPNPEFYRTVFFEFFSDDLEKFFRVKGLELKVENRGRVLPVTDTAKSVVAVLKDYLKENHVTVVFGKRVISIERQDDCFILAVGGKDYFKARKVIISTGGVTYKATGSTGDGLDMAKRLGHTITKLSPGLVPLKIKENFIKKLQGLSFDDARVTFQQDNKKIVSHAGEIIFTHFGLSGPLALDISAAIVRLLTKHKEIKIDIDFCPGYKREELESILVKKITACGRVQIKSFMESFLPKRMAPVFLSRVNIQPDKVVSQISKHERSAIINNLKAFSLSVNGSLSMDEAMVTCGGVSMKEINPRTMESKLVHGLYFAGEILESAGESGGYNLQQAFSTGYAAGSVKKWI